MIGTRTHEFIEKVRTGIAGDDFTELNNHLEDAKILATAIDVVVAQNAHLGIPWQEQCTKTLDENVIEDVFVDGERTVLKEICDKLDGENQERCRRIIYWWERSLSRDR